MVNNNEWQSFGDLFEDYVAKNREGEAGIWFNIVFDKEKQRFLEVTP